MGSVIQICDCSKQNPHNIISRVSRLKNQASSQNLMVKKLLFHQIADLFPFRYLGKGLYGTTVEVFVKQNKNIKFAEKIVPEDKLRQNYICYDKEIVDRIMLDPILKHKIVKVHAYSISPENKKMYLIMDLMKKGDLYFHLCRLSKKNGRFYPQRAIKSIAFQLLQIIQKFHSYSIIFRNLRSENIFIKQNGKLAVSDFFFAINSRQCQTFYGAAQYSPPQVYNLQKTIKNKQFVMKNFVQIPDQIQQLQLRRSPDVRRFRNVNAHQFDLKSRSCDLKQQMEYLKLRKAKQNKQFQSNKQKVIIQTNVIQPLPSLITAGLQKKQLNTTLKRIQSKDDIKDSQREITQNHQKIPTRKSIRNLTTLHIIRPERQKHMTYVIPEDTFGQTSQVKQESTKLLKDDGKGPIRNSLQKQKDYNSSNYDYSSEQQGEKRTYDLTIDTWMLGVLLFQLICGRTPFQKWKGSCDALSKTPVCNSNKDMILDLQHQVKNRDISQIWPIPSNQTSQSSSPSPLQQQQANLSLTNPNFNSNTTNQQQNTVSISNLQKDFIQLLLIRQPTKRKKISELKKHPFISDCQLEIPIEELIYGQKFKENSFNEDIKFYLKNKDSGLIASRTILKKTSHSQGFRKNRITQKLFQHQKSNHNQER